MTITSALKRVFWRFEKIKTNETDQIALDTITDFVNQKHKQQIQDYHLFAKLYIMVYSQFLEQYKTDVFDDIPRKELNKMLSRPIEVFIERFKNRLNDSELYTTFTDLGISLEHPATITDKQRSVESKILEDNVIDIQPIWDFETVKERLELQINLTINALEQQ